jgi:hypothetical protein
MLTSSNVIFYIAFLGQILLVSYYFPGKIMARIKFVRETYPPDQYPRLYPKNQNQFIVGYRRFKLISNSIFALGFVVLFMVMFVVDHATFADDGYISEAFPAIYGMLQFLPLMALEISEFNQFKLMRQAEAGTTRTADLRRRGLFDLVSPKLFFLALTLFFAAVVFDFYVRDFDFSIGLVSIQRTLVLACTNLLLVALGAWLMYGKKLNPHQSADDRFRHIGVSLHSFVYVSMALSVFWMTQAADDLVDLAFLDATIMSVYFQVIALLSIGTLLRNMKLEDVNFEVYRDSPAPT